MRLSQSASILVDSSSHARRTYQHDMEDDDMIHAHTMQVSIAYMNQAFLKWLSISRLYHSGWRLLNMLSDAYEVLSRNACLF